MSKLPLALVLGFTFASISVALGQGNVQGTTRPADPAADLSAGGLTLPRGGASATGAASKGDATDDEDDPTLQRLKSKDSMGQGGFSRDEGQLTAKARRREKISTESTKQLHTSGTDPKFQGSLLHSSVGSIEEVGATANTSAGYHMNAETAAQPQNQAEAQAQAEAEAQAQAEEKAEDQARFKNKHLVFTPMTGGDSKKKESPSTNADSSPSPSPSASASGSPSSR